MKRSRWKKAALALGAALLAILVGCQAVGGYNLNDMLTAQFEVKASESSGTVELALDWDEEQVAQEDPEAARIIDGFRTIKLTIDHAMNDSDGNVWAQGRFELGQANVPFTLQKDRTRLLLQVEGIKRPLELKLADAENGSLWPGMGGEGWMNGAANGGGEANEADQAALEQAVAQAGRELGSYIVKHLPNPPKINVDLLTWEPIHGVSTKLAKVHAELNGRELGELVPRFVDALASDEEGMRELFTKLIALQADLPPAMTEAVGLEGEAEKPSDEEVNEAVSYLIGALKEAGEQLAEESKTDEWNEIFDDGIGMKADLYVDDALHIRKSDVELSLSAELFKDSGLPLKGLQLRTSQETWNVNGDVTVPALPAAPYAYDLDAFFGLEPFQALKLMDESSDLYKLLKNDLEIDDQEITLSSDWGVPFVRSDDGDIYVPVRETIEQLGGRFLVYDEGSKGVRFYDEATRQTLELKIGSADLLANDKPVHWTHEVEAVDGLAYAAADDLLATLHATYSLGEGEYGDTELVIDRDL